MSIARRLVRLVVPFAAAALCGAALAGEPMTAQKLVALHEAGLEDDAIHQLAAREGFAQALGTDDVLALREAGLSADLVSDLVGLSADEEVRIEEREGVTVITGRGPEDAGDDSDEEPPARDEDWAPAQPPALPPATVVVVAPQAPAETQPRQEGFPVGAEFGFSGGAVFLPSNFAGTQPSAFGKTIVGFTPHVHDGACCGGYPYWTPSFAPVQPAPVQPERRLTPIRTSRGRLWVPN